MTQPANGNEIELRRIVRMLDKTVEMAQDAEMTGSLAERSAAAVRSYNTTVRHLISIGQIPTALFAPLPDDANLTDVAMSSAQVAEYLRAGLPDAEEQEQGGPTVDRRLIVGNINLGGGSDKDELAQMIRDHLAEWFGEAKTQAAPEAAEGVAGGEAASSAAASAPAGEPAASPRRAALPSQARVEELRSEGQAAAEARRS
jgi:hypothetical protein